jgi:putative ABC transport system substrate-binding protein
LRPGGNATGFTQITFELTGKRLELLKEAVPRLARVGALHTGDMTSLVDDLEELRRVAKALGIEVVAVGANSKEAYAEAFATLREAQVDALFVLASIANFVNRQVIAELALKHRLPTVTEASAHSESGALMSYGPDLIVLRRRAARYVDQILKGAKPSELPVQRPTDFELVINLKTAKALGITIPQSLLLRADEVLE